LHLEEGES